MSISRLVRIKFGVYVSTRVHVIVHAHFTTTTWMTSGTVLAVFKKYHGYLGKVLANGQLTTTTLI